MRVLKMLNQSIWVMCGGALGAWCRFALQQKMPFQWANVTISTLGINVLGGFIMGGVAAWLMGKSFADQTLWRALLMSGFCGGFTTFSAFSLEMWQLLQAGKPINAMAMALAHVVLSLMAVMLGWVLVRGSVH